MTIQYDPKADAAYITVNENPAPNRIARTIPCDPAIGMINLDFTADGKLSGIEVLDAKKLLPSEVLQQASSIYQERNNLHPDHFTLDASRDIAHLQFVYEPDKGGLREVRAFDPADTGGDIVFYCSPENKIIAMSIGQASHVL